jgi:hypothetical protein
MHVNTVEDPVVLSGRVTCSCNLPPTGGFEMLHAGTSAAVRGSGGIMDAALGSPANAFPSAPPRAAFAIGCCG